LGLDSAAWSKPCFGFQFVPYAMLLAEADGSLIDLPSAISLASFF